ncbi:hypothetical protein AB0B94_30930 [Micromonospora sp. NPDC048986]|uniref:hypothetical protein n=1 Tax=Micromonospora sp. NPDC048986 TaxID=3155644 RepID=UPI0033C70B25
MSDLARTDDVIDAEIVDETCSCGKPGRLIIDPYAQDVNNETVMVVMCDDCEDIAVLEI